MPGAASGGQDQQPQANTPGGGVAGAPPVGTPDPLQKYKWWIFSGLGIVLVVGAAFMLRAKPSEAGHIFAAEPSPLTSALPPGVKATEYRAKTLGAAPTNGAPPNTVLPSAPASTAATPFSSSASTSASLIAAPASVPSPAVSPSAPPPMLAALKEELFQLETERIEGHITNAEYSEQKAALEVMLKRALARQTVTR